MNFDKWLEGYAPTAPERLDECAKDAWIAATKAEREACAKLCDGLTTGDNWAETSDELCAWDKGASDCAAAIRIRTASEAAEAYKTYEEWEYADREAAWKWMYERGVEAGNAHIYEAEAAQITRPLRELLKRTLPMISGAGCGTLAAEICKAIGMPNA